MKAPRGGATLLIFPWKYAQLCSLGQTKLNVQKNPVIPPWKRLISIKPKLYCNVWEVMVKTRILLWHTCGYFCCNILVTVIAKVQLNTEKAAQVSISEGIRLIFDFVCSWLQVWSTLIADSCQEIPPMQLKIDLRVLWTNVIFSTTGAIFCSNSGPMI